MGCSLPGSSVHGIFQARILEWVAGSYSRGSSQAREADSLPLAPPGKPIYVCMGDTHKCTHIAVTIKSVNRVYLFFCFFFLFLIWDNVYFKRHRYFFKYPTEQWIPWGESPEKVPFQNSQDSVQFGPWSSQTTGPFTMLVLEYGASF